jgi:plasmid stabilization system protein ParE
MKRVVLSASARSFLLAEATYLLARNPVAAERFVARLREARTNLARFEALGFERDAPPVPGIRRLVVGDYLLDYGISDVIEVVAIRHGRQSDPDLPIDDDFDFEA